MTETVPYCMATVESRYSFFDDKCLLLQTEEWSPVVCGASNVAERSMLRPSKRVRISTNTATRVVSLLQSICRPLKEIWIPKALPVDTASRAKLYDASNYCMNTK